MKLGMTKTWAVKNGDDTVTSHTAVFLSYPLEERGIRNREILNTAVFPS